MRRLSHAFQSGIQHYIVDVFSSLIISSFLVKSSLLCLGCFSPITTKLEKILILGKVFRFAKPLWNHFFFFGNDNPKKNNHTALIDILTSLHPLPTLGNLGYAHLLDCVIVYLILTNWWPVLCGFFPPISFRLNSIVSL